MLENYTINNVSGRNNRAAVPTLIAGTCSTAFHLQVASMQDHHPCSFGPRQLDA